MIKQIRAYAVTAESMPDLDQLGLVTSAYPARECKYQEKECLGFRVLSDAKSTDKTSVLSVCSQRFSYLEVARYTRNVPENLLKRELSRKIKEIEESTGEAPSRAETKAIRDEIWITLLPRMPQIETIIPVVFDYQTYQIWLCSTSEGIAESIRSLLRRAGLAITATPLFQQIDVGSTLADWLLETRDLPDDLFIGTKARAVDPHDTKATISLSNEELLEDKLQQVLASRAITQLQLATKTTSFVFSHDGSLKTIKHSEPDEAPEDITQLLSYYLLELASTLEIITTELGAPAELN